MSYFQTTLGCNCKDTTSHTAINRLLTFKTCSNIYRDGSVFY